MIKREITKKIFEGMLVAALSECNYECVQERDYIKAFSTNDNEKNLLIYPACRCLSENESYIVNISSNIKNKIEAKSKETVDEFIPCIAFCIGKYSYLSSEITIVPTSVWENSLKGSVFSTSNEKYYYNPIKVTNSDNFLLQVQWKGEIK